MTLKNFGYSHITHTHTHTPNKLSDMHAGNLNHKKKSQRIRRKEMFNA